MIKAYFSTLTEDEDRSTGYIRVSPLCSTRHKPGATNLARSLLFLCVGECHARAVYKAGRNYVLIAKLKLELKNRL